MKEKKILIIDDDPIILFMHQSILEDISPGGEIICLENGKVAYEYIVKNQHAELLLLLDINMPVMNGWALLELLVKTPECKRISVVLVTSSVNESDRIRASAYPMVVKVLFKPLREKDLLELSADKRIRLFF
ncbi:response regulator [Pedobacter fastidiosus]|uniref:Response regulator n=1 Tax=Pedobacter fastidiosus TaxID=2765361 RepID=A0ABR7KYR4_9SPHI|nr:response regulator [Pedobacter fastidiosus]MBC6113170.1 response regulator [Pedobacter fastidiosus]